MGAKTGQTGRKAGQQRLALILFGALLVVLFAGFAIAQGIGRESVPSGDVVLVEDVPDGTISEAEYKRAFVQQVAVGGLKKVPKEGSTKFEELRSATLGELLDFIWIRGQAEELDLTATPKKIAEELEQIKEQNFPTPAAYNEFLKTSKFTQEDVERRVELQVLSNKIQEAITAETPIPTNAEIANFYESVKASQFTIPSSRDIRFLSNKDKAEVEAAKAALEKDDSAASWKEVAAKYSTDPATKSTGGLRPGLNEELLVRFPPLQKAVLDGATNELVGPFKFEGKYSLVEVIKLNPAKEQTLAEVRAQIASQVQQQKQEAFFEQFITKFQTKWQSRTICASGYEIERCSNFKGDGHPSTASAACYEADPKAGTPAECPAVVTPASPAVPGSVTLLQPKGTRLPQRPVPVAAAKAGGAAGEVLPEGAAPTGEGAAPTGE